MHVCSRGSQFKAVGLEAGYLVLLYNRNYSVAERKKYNMRE